MQLHSNAEYFTAQDGGVIILQYKGDSNAALSEDGKVFHHLQDCRRPCCKNFYHDDWRGLNFSVKRDGDTVTVDGKSFVKQPCPLEIDFFGRHPPRGQQLTDTVT